MLRMPFCSTIFRASGYFTCLLALLAILEPHGQMASKIIVVLQDITREGITVVAMESALCVLEPGLNPKTGILAAAEMVELAFRNIYLLPVTGGKQTECTQVLKIN